MIKRTTNYGALTSDVWNQSTLHTLLLKWMMLHPPVGHRPVPLHPKMLHHPDDSTPQLPRSLVSCIWESRLHCSNPRSPVLYLYI